MRLVGVVSERVSVLVRRERVRVWVGVGVGVGVWVGVSLRRRALVVLRIGLWLVPILRVLLLMEGEVGV